MSVACAPAKYEYCDPALRKFLHAVYMARKHHSTVAEIDNALGTKDHKTLCNLMSIEECEQLIGESLRSENGDDCPEFSAEGLVNVENDVQIKYANIFEQYKQKLDEDFEYPCSSCERLHKKVMLLNIMLMLQNFPLISGNS